MGMICVIAMGGVYGLIRDRNRSIRNVIASSDLSGRNGNATVHLTASRKREGHYCEEDYPRSQHPRMSVVQPELSPKKKPLHIRTQSAVSGPPVPPPVVGGSGQVYEGSILLEAKKDGTLVGAVSGELAKKTALLVKMPDTEENWRDSYTAILKKHLALDHDGLPSLSVGRQDFLHDARRCVRASGVDERLISKVMDMLETWSLDVVRSCARYLFQQMSLESGAGAAAGEIAQQLAVLGLSNAKITRKSDGSYAVEPLTDLVYYKDAKGQTRQRGIDTMSINTDGKSGLTFVATFVNARKACIAVAEGWEGDGDDYQIKMTEDEYHITRGEGEHICFHIEKKVMLALPDQAPMPVNKDRTDAGKCELGFFYEMYGTHERKGQGDPLPWYGLIQTTCLGSTGSPIDRVLQREPTN